MADPKMTPPIGPPIMAPKRPPDANPAAPPATPPTIASGSFFFKESCISFMTLSFVTASPFLSVSPNMALCQSAKDCLIESLIPVKMPFRSRSPVCSSFLPKIFSMIPSLTVPIMEVSDFSWVRPSESTYALPVNRCCISKKESCNILVMLDNAPPLRKPSSSLVPKSLAFIGFKSLSSMEDTIVVATPPIISPASCINALASPLTNASPIRDACCKDAFRS